MKLIIKKYSNICELEGVSITNATVKSIGEIKEGEPVEVILSVLVDELIIAHSTEVDNALNECVSKIKVEHIERDIVSLEKLEQLISSGWAVYEVEDTDDIDLKLLILARANL